MSRPVATAIGIAMVAVALGGTAAPALARQDVATSLEVRGEVAPVDGQAVMLRVSLTDANGGPVAGQLLRLVVPVGFMGATKNEIVGEGTTNEAGTATIRFAPSQPGTVQGTVSFWGAPGYAPSDTAVTLEVTRPAVTYHPTPVGLQAPWARAAFIPIPFAAVWLTYLFVLWFVARMRRAGKEATPSERTAES